MSEDPISREMLMIALVEFLDRADVYSNPTPEASWRLNRQAWDEICHIPQGDHARLRGITDWAGEITGPRGDVIRPPLESTTEIDDSQRGTYDNYCSD